ncbi:hypothetical protein HDU76_004665 [Blyttiomyces sp. JEL0837]|nr:hypothetical protein HDU76_004665 [Blyttiomyces sp. JEL0837]
MKKHTKEVFEIPAEKKNALSMTNSSAFLGYNKLGFELTKNVVDQREQFDFAPERDYPKWKPGLPQYIRLHGASQWPDEEDLPGFKEDTKKYMDQLVDLSHQVTELIAERLDLPSTFFDKYFKEDVPEGGRMKMIRYPPATPDGSGGDQGVGPHRDFWLTFLLQVNDVPGLQVQNDQGQWIDAPPLPNTFILNFGIGLERVTRNAVIATTHRVISPPSTSLESRYSLPFFQSLSLEAVIDPIPLDEMTPIMISMADRNVNSVVTDADMKQLPVNKIGEGTLVNRIKSHPDVGIRQYPDLFEEVVGDVGSLLHPGYLEMVKVKGA